MLVMLHIKLSTFWTYKNKDYVVAEQQALLSASSCTFVSGLFPPLPEESAKSSKFSSIGSQFKQQRQSLLETLSATEPHYIRCVKPKNLLKPSIFENQNVLQQLHFGGVMEAIRISCSGYPTRKAFDEFMHRFGVLAPDVLKGSCEERTACKRIIERVDLNGYQIGKTKVFLRAGQMVELDVWWSEVLGKSASIIQRKVRSYFARKSYTELCISAMQIQASCRGEIARHLYECMRREAACLRIQKDAHMFLARKTYLDLCLSALSIQTGMRGMAARILFQNRKQTQAAVFIQAAKETGALQEAKIKLEKEVEELTLCLQLEKRMRVDLEEAKSQEIVRLQSTLEEIQLQFQETKELLMKEREAAKKVAEVVPIVQEIQVVDQEIVNQLTAENKQLKALVNSLEKKIHETEKKYEETSRLGEERLKQALDAETKIFALKTAMQSLQEKLSDMETEDQILRQKALLNSTPWKMSRHLAVPSQECQDVLMNCVTQDLGFSEGKPVAAYTIFKCLVHWRSFETERTSIFDRLIQMIGSAIEDESNNDRMTYWLSNTSTLLFLLQQTMKIASSTAPKPPQPTAFFGRVIQSFRSSPSSSNLSINGLERVRQVEAKYPALLFKQQLTAYVEKIYGIIRDNQTKELSSFISSCIRAPRMSRGNSQASGKSTCCTSPSNPWQGMIGSLNNCLNMLKENSVPSVLSQKIFTQIFSYINVQLFNSLLLRRECCTFDNGEYVKAGLAELELWCGEATEEYVGSSWDELKHVRQAVGFLVIHQKSRVSYDDVKNDLCPVLSVQQLYRICTIYHDDNYHTPKVAQEVIFSMKILVAEEANNADSQSFLLDDNSSIPFSVDDICIELKEIDFKGARPTKELLENPAFQFLQE